MDRKFSRPTAVNCVAEASRLANLLVEAERRDGLDCQLAIERAEQRWGFDHNTLYRLRYRIREIDDVKASTLEALRWAWELTFERQRQLEIAEIEAFRRLETHRDDSIL